MFRGKESCSWRTESKRQSPAGKSCWKLTTASGRQRHLLEVRLGTHQKGSRCGLGRAGCQRILLWWGKIGMRKEPGGFLPPVQRSGSRSVIQQHQHHRRTWQNAYSLVSPHTSWIRKLGYGVWKYVISKHSGGFRWTGKFDKPGLEQVFSRKELKGWAVHWPEILAMTGLSQPL